MKKLKMAFMAFAALSSIGSAFAFSPAAKKHSSLTYYAVRQAGGGFKWQTTQPNSADFTCTPGTQGVCTIVTSTVPMDNQVPANHSSDAKGLYEAI